MKRALRVALAVLPVVLMATAVSAQATTILPANTKVSATGTNATYIYGVFNVGCNTTTFTGTTTNPASGSLTGALTITNSPAGCATNVGVTCFITQAAPATITIHATATGSGNGTGTATIDGVYTDNCGSGFCILTIPKQTTSSTTAVFTAANDTLQVTASLTGTRTGPGGALCGPASGTSVITATLTPVTPSNLTITNP